MTYPDDDNTPASAAFESTVAAPAQSYEQPTESTDQDKDARQGGESVGAPMPEGYSPEPAAELHRPSAQYPHAHDGQSCEVCEHPELTHDETGEAVEIDQLNEDR